MSRGIVVDHKETGVRYAISEDHFNKEVHKKVRELKPGETILGFRPLARESLGGGTNTPEAAAKSESDVSGASQTDTSTTTKATPATK